MASFLNKYTLVATMGSAIVAATTMLFVPMGAVAFEVDDAGRCYWHDIVDDIAVEQQHHMGKAGNSTAIPGEAAASSANINTTATNTTAPPPPAAPERKAGECGELLREAVCNRTVMSPTGEYTRPSPVCNCGEETPL